MEFRILGPLEVVADGPPPNLGSPKQRALLALLVLHANEIVSRDRLIEALWGETAPPSAAHAVEVYVSKLRKALAQAAGAGAAPRLETRAPGYVLELGAGALDLDQFERLRYEGARALEEGRLEPAAAKLREALGLWRGPPLVDFSYEAFAQDEITRLDELWLATLEQRIEADLALARHAELVPELEALVLEHPLREGLSAALMLALYRVGRQADALEVYRRTRRLLQAELGLEPAPFLRELEASILRQDPELAVESPELRARRHLPAPATAFIGRAREVEEIVDLLRSDVRLLTLTGPGGIGKTRLAIECAGALADRFAHGVFFVDLASTSDTDLFGPTIAHALEVPEGGGAEPLAALAQHLRERQLLLVLDNFEQIEPAAPLVGDLLRASHSLKVLVTSRSPLRLYGESEYLVPPLSLPAAENETRAVPYSSEAVALFLARAQAARRGFDVDQHAPAIRELCVRLDGLPLALELAAARTRELSPERMLEALPQRLELASRGPRDVPQRQRTLRATLEWSHDLLDELEQRSFAHLAVFAGGATTEAAERVAGAAGEVVQALVEKSLLVATERSAGRRFGMLETVREFANEQLSALPEADELRQRHAEYFGAMAEDVEDRLVGGIDDRGPLDRVEDEHDNLRAALGWLRTTGQPEQELRLATALKLFWWVRGHLSEGRHWLEGALGRGELQQPALRAKGLAAAGVLAYKQADYARAAALWEEGLDLYRSLDDAEGVARALAELGGVAVAEGHYDRGTELYEESRDLYRKLGETLSLGTVLANLGDIALNRGDYDTAAERCEEALALQRQLGDKEGPAISLFNLSRAELGRGRRAEAAASLAESLELARAIGYRELIAYCLEGIAGVAATSAALAERAASLSGAAQALFDALGLVPQAHELELHEQALEQLRAHLGPPAYDLARSTGRRFELERAIGDAIELARELMQTAVR